MSIVMKGNFLESFFYKMLLILMQLIESAGLVFRFLELSICFKSFFIFSKICKIFQNVFHTWKFVANVRLKLIQAKGNSVCCILQLEEIAQTLKDENLKLTLPFGIGMHHAGLQQHERNVVEQVFFILLTFFTKLLAN